MAPIPLRPLTAGDVISSAFSIYGRRFWDLAIVAAVILVPITILSIIVELALVDLATLDPNNIQPGDVLGPLALLLVLALISFVGTLLITGAVAESVALAHLDATSDWNESIGAAGRKLGSLAGNAILNGLGVFAGLILCLLPGIYLGISWITAPVAVMLEDAGPAGALGRSSRLVSGRWWPVFGIVILAGLLIGVAGFVGGLILGAFLLPADSASLGFIVTNNLIDLVLGVALQPFFAVVITILYLEMRARKEGFDLAQLAHRLGVPVPEGIDPIEPPWDEGPTTPWGDDS